MFNGEMFDADVCVIGGGPAGLAAAIAARRKGFSVIVADSLAFPIDKACGEGLLPDSLEALHELGLTAPVAEGYVFDGLRFLQADRLADGARAEARFRRGFGLAIRRTVLHRWLVEQAIHAGVNLLWQTPVVSISAEPAIVTLAHGRQQLRVRWIVGADGERSRVREWAGLASASRSFSRFGFRRHYRKTPASPLHGGFGGGFGVFIDAHWAHDCQVYVTPVASDQVGVAILSRDPHMRVDEALARVPALQEWLGQSEIVSHERGALSSTRRLRAVYRGKIALVGDASGSVDAITGEGLGLAFVQAAALADAMANGDLREYQAAHRRITRRPCFMAELMLSMDRWPSIRARALHALAARPELFERLLAFHVGQLDSFDGIAVNADLAWSILHG